MKFHNRSLLTTLSACVLGLGLLSCAPASPTDIPTPPTSTVPPPTVTLTPTPQTPTVTPTPAPIAGGWNLGRTFAKLEAGNKITLGFLGGSITNGDGTSNPDATSYRALVTQWFKEEFPAAEITSLNGGTSGTGSLFGAFRAYRDVGQADLVFIEFAVNDGGANASNRDDYLKYTEGIVRRLYLANPNVEIVFVDLATAKMADAYGGGSLPEIVQLHHETADHYTVPGVNDVLYINPGKDMVDYINSGQATWTGGSNPLTSDNVHPNDTGHQFIVDKIIAVLQYAREVSTPLPAFDNLPAPLHPAPVDNGQLIDTSAAVWPSGEWVYKTPSDYPRAFVSQLSAAAPGATLDYTFTGQYIGLSIIQTVQGGAFEAWVDDGPAKTYSLSAPFTRRDMVLISGNETGGTHTLHIRVAALPVTIMAFAVNP